MPEIFQDKLPDEMASAARLPGVAPCGAADWLRVDEAYGAQMAYRVALLAQQPEAVLRVNQGVEAAVLEVLEEALKILPSLGFEVGGERVICPDERQVTLDRSKPLHTLGALVQEDICILEKQGDQHVLSAGLVCFPASWRLADKIGRPLSTIHDPVPEYDESITRRVQRLFDGVQVGRPLWRFNRLTYARADLHQPRRENADAERVFERAERQCIVRLPQSDAVVFSIHTYVIDPR